MAAGVGLGTSGKTIRGAGVGAARGGVGGEGVGVGVGEGRDGTVGSTGPWTVGVGVGAGGNLKSVTEAPAGAASKAVVPARRNAR